MCMKTLKLIHQTVHLEYDLNIDTDTNIFVFWDHSVITFPLRPLNSGVWPNSTEQLIYLFLACERVTVVVLVQALLPQNNWPKKSLLYDLPILSLLHGKSISQSAQSLSHARLFVTPSMAACQASLSITNSQSLLKLMSVMSINHLILCRPLLLLPSILSSLRVFSSESVLRIRWPKYWSFSSASVLPMNI